MIVAFVGKHIRSADEERAERLARVLHVLYLIFNEGYAASGGASLLRSDLANEAIRFTRISFQN